MESFKSTRRCGIDNCRSRRYHIAEDGYTYCENSHRQDVGLVIGEDDYRPGVSQAYAETTRAQREEREVVPTYFEGHEAIILYLQCFQLILRKQVKWLISMKKYPEELQTVIRDLWTLRMQMLHSIIEAPNAAGAQQLFSTQTDTDDSDREFGSSQRAQSRLFHLAPKLDETLALCYLGSVLLRIPICSGQILEWIGSEGFPFLNALIYVPNSMTGKLPSKLRRKLHVRNPIGILDTFHLKVLNLIWAFKGSFGMDFPAPNCQLLLFHFITSLSLPLDVFVFTEYLAQLLDYRFEYPQRPPMRSTPRRLRHPELRLLATMVVTAKLLYPFDSDSVSRHPMTSDSPPGLIMDWNAWNVARRGQNQSFVMEAPKSSTANPSSSKTKPAAVNPMLTITEHDAMHMSKQDIDSYLNWFNDTWIDLPKDEDGNETGAFSLPHQRSEGAARVEFRRMLFNLFPTRVSGASEEVADSGADDEMDTSDDLANDNIDNERQKTESNPTVQRIRATQASLQLRQHIPATVADDEELEIQIYTKPGPKPKNRPNPLDEGPLRPGAQYKHYRTLEEVPEVGLAFYEDAAQLVGLDVRRLVTAVFKVEMDMSRWVDGQKKAEIERLKNRRVEVNLDEDVDMEWT